MSECPLKKKTSRSAIAQSAMDMTVKASGILLLLPGGFHRTDKKTKPGE
jgi:hypothetical protein